MRRFTWTLVVVSILSTSAVILLWADLNAERELSGSLRSRIASLQSTRVATTSESAKLPFGQPLPSEPTNGAVSPVQDSVAPSRDTSFSIEEEMALERRLMGDPRYREAFRAQSIVEEAPRRANLIRLLGFTPEQADAVIAMEIDRRIEESAGSAAKPMSEEQRNADEQAQLGKLLGEDKRQRLQYYLDTTQSRMQVDDFRTQLTGADALRDDQVESLIDAIHPAQQQMWQELKDARATPEWDDPGEAARRRNMDYVLEHRQAANERMHQAASGVLTSAQLRQFDTWLQRHLDLMQNQQRLDGIRATMEDASHSAPPGSSN